jgi:hypothetical protein
MLYAYPVQAAGENWLHDCIGEVLRRVHDCIVTGQRIPVWPNIIPELYRAQLATRNGLKDRLAKYVRVVSTLPLGERERIIRAFADENRIAELLACDCDCESIEDLPEICREPIRDLFSFTFKLLTGLGIRDQAYHVIYGTTGHRVCAFCGLEYFEAAGGPREALDHYLSQSQYPFAAANLRNLVPMGHKCNSKYKLAQDILRKADGTRRRSFDPYGATAEIRVCLSQSQPFAGTDGLLPLWIIEFEPNGEEVTTWDDVFRVRERYQRDILDADFKSWLKDFSAWCRSARIHLSADQILLDALERYAGFQDECGLRDRSFLKAAMFRMLLRHCRDGNERLSELLRDLSP